MLKHINLISPFHMWFLILIIIHTQWFVSL